MSAQNRPSSRVGFDIAIICALTLEANAILCSLEEVWDDDARHQYGRTTGDKNHYAFGRSGIHAVVVVTLPQMGNVSSAGTATALSMSFPSIKLALLVGICGAAPITTGDNKQKEILLGDVILSEELVRLDFGRQYPHRFERKRTIRDVPGRPCQDILGLLQHLKTPIQLEKFQLSMREKLARTMQHPQIGTAYPDAPDRLFAANYIHRHRGGDCIRCGTSEDVCDAALKLSCEELACDEAFLVHRERLSARGGPTGRDVSQQQIHFGAIGTAEMVMRSAAHRDMLAEAEGIIAFEMEGAGVWDNLNCLIIKGVCDYADSHKSKRWQGYAAAVAAAAAVAVLAQYVGQDRPALFKFSGMAVASRAADESLTKEIFDRVFKEFEMQFTPEQLQEFRDRDLRGLKQELKSIQDEQERTRSLRNMRRIERFLVNMEQFGTVVHKILGESSATKLMGFVWGPARALLRIARGYTDLLDTLLSAYERIGEELPVIDDNGEVFQHYVGFQRLLARIFLDIVMFHANALELYSGRALKALFRPLWQDFKPIFESTLRRMRSYKTLIEDRAQATLSAPEKEEATSQEIRQLLQQADKEIIDSKDQARRNQNAKLDELRDWIAAADAQAYHNDICRDRRQYPNSGDWILENTKVTDWLFQDSNRSTASILWINGRPGTGKTYLASVLIEACMENSDWTTSYFYCSEAMQSGASSIAIFRGLLMQLLYQHKDLIPFCHAKMKESHSPSLSDLSTACTLLETFCERVSRLYMVIDGLDECEEGRKDAIETLKNLINQAETHSPGTLRVLFLSRPSPEIRNSIPEADVLALEPEHNQVDIERYCQCRSRELQKFKLAETDVTEAIQKICIRADGIFLFAKLVINNLAKLPNTRRFDREIRDPRLPKELNSAYARIMDRLKQDLSKEQLEYTVLLLGWLVCSKRPMKWTEMQVALSIDLHAPGTSKYLDVGLQLRDDVQELCGSLVQVLKGNRVELVHNTAKHFISNQSDINLAAAECDLTLRCLRYLTMDFFRRETSDQELRVHALRGDFAFQDYAVSNWYLHVRTMVEMRQAFLEAGVYLSDEESTSPVVMIAQELRNFVRFYPESFPTSEVLESSHMDCVFFQQYPFHHLLVRVWDHICSAQRGDLTARNTVSIEPLQAALTRNRTLLERLSMEPSIVDLPLLYDEFPFRCPKVLCFYFHEGFRGAETRDSHVNYHDLPFHCPVEDCSRYVMGFQSNTSLNAHLKRFHPEKCDLSDSFTLLNRRPVNSSRWQCDVCLKFFVRPNILVDHQRTHTGEKPFCCSECGRGFARKNDMKRHEKIHERRK